jgi:dTDP-4-amino-4,6-dideoxygalactose transaminase
MNKKIWLSPPHMGGEELTLIKEAFDTNWVSPAGPHIDAFEMELCAYNKIAHAAALSSGTAAIHISLLLLGVGQGDEVLCSTFTFAGTCNPIAYVGAIPVFIDSERDTWNMDPEMLEQAIQDRLRKGKKPKAIIPVHLYGMPAKISEIKRIAAQYEIPIIEDAAEAIGSKYQGAMMGTFGDIGIYSFNGNKIITTSGGGALVSNNLDWVQRAKFLSTQARDPAPHYQHSQIGYNYRLSNICAGIGRAQLRVLDQRVLQRRKIFDRYRLRLNAVQGLHFQQESDESFSNRWLTCIVLDKSISKSPDVVRLALQKHEIESRPLWKPMHLQPVFAGAPYYGQGISDDLFDHGLCLPSGSNLSDDDHERICEIILKTLND